MWAIIGCGWSHTPTQTWNFLGFYSSFSLYYYTGCINIYTLILTLLYYSSMIYVYKDIY